MRLMMARHSISIDTNDQRDNTDPPVNFGLLGAFFIGLLLRSGFTSSRGFTLRDEPGMSLK